MATPTSPGVISFVNYLTSDNKIDSLIYGIKWGGTPGTGVDLTYSFGGNSSYYTLISSYDPSKYYGYSNEPFTGFGSLTNVQINAVRNALSAWSEVADINFTEVLDSYTVAGDLRFARTTAILSENSIANTYLPDSTPEAGDVWFKYNSKFNTDIEGTEGYATFLHEIGHALGLKHPHENGLYTDEIADFIIANPDIDTTKYTVMSYRSYVGQVISQYTQTFFPTTPMLNDIAAIQYLYGANTSTRSGNTNYRWSPGEQLLETIWDGGGVDTIDWSNQSTAAKINLNAGEWSELGPSYWNGIAYESETLAIAYNVTIENAKGGTKNDRIIGNEAANNLKGGGGADTLTGGDGNDTLIGGGGRDYLEGNAGRDRLIGGGGHDSLYGGADRDILKGNKGNDTLVGGNGNDVLFGNEGRDLFVLESNQGRDVIKDFVDGIDYFTIGNGLTFDDLTIRNNSRGTAAIIRDNTNTAIAVVSNVDASLITESDFLVAM